MESRGVSGDIKRFVIASDSCGYYLLMKYTCTLPLLETMLLIRSLEAG